MIPGVNTSFMTFNICYDVQRTHDLIVTDWPVSDRQSYFKTSLLSWTGNAENTAVLINLISVLTVDDGVAGVVVSPQIRSQSVIFII